MNFTMRQFDDKEIDFLNSFLIPKTVRETEETLKTIKDPQLLFAYRMRVLYETYHTNKEVAYYVFFQPNQITWDKTFKEIETVSNVFLTIQQIHSKTNT